MMSGLVSYGSSDDSESSDGEDSPPLEAKSREVGLKSHGAAKPSMSVPKKSSLFASLPKPKVNHTPALEEARSTAPSVKLRTKDEDGSQKKSLFSALPPPKKMAKTTPNSAEPTSEAKGGPALMTGGSSAKVSKGLLNLPPPKKKQPVKISLPALPDPDSDEDEPESKRPKSTKGAGLFAVLPKPKTMSRKEAQRPLIPYTLTKKPAAGPAKPPGKPPVQSPSQPLAQPTAQSAKPIQHKSVNKPTGNNPLVTGYNSDEDDEDDDDGDGVSFFSMGDSDSVKERTKEKSVTGSHPHSKQLATDLPVGSNKDSVKDGGLQTESGNGAVRTGSGTDPGLEAAPGVVEPSIPSNQDQPLVFNSSKSNTSGYSAANYSRLHAMYNPQYHEQSSQGVSYAQPSDGSEPSGSYSQTGLDTQNASDGIQCYNQPYQEGGGTEYDQSNTNTQSSSQSFLQDERFAKMVGKNNRGREEIQFIDINADDQIGPTTGLQQMVKSMTEEKEYRGKLKKEQLPTSQQKRKHQITYLARQAKERELELKNQWAENRQNRKSTNAKYGFF